MIARAGNWLLGLTVAAWLTATPYLLARLGAPVPVELARIDGPHIYVGIALAVVLALKVHQLHFGGALAKMRGVLAYQRWLSLGLLVTYGGVLMSGALLALPWPATTERQLVNFHLLTAGWAGVVTLAHIARYFARRVALPAIDARLVAGLVIVLLPALLFAAAPRSASPLSRLGAGASWQPAAQNQPPVTRLARLPGGDLVAVGGGLEVSRDNGQTWQSDPELGGTIVRAIAAPSSGSPVYIATERGVMSAPSAVGPYAATGLKVFADSILVDVDGRIWAGGAGLWSSSDGGATWSPAEGGLTPEGSIWSIGRFNGELLAGGTTGVYRWDGSRWQQTSTLRSVYSLDAGPDGEVWASSMGYGLQVLRNGRWETMDSGLSAHNHGGASRAIHVDGYTWLGGDRAMVATMDNGVAESTDGGATWSQPAPGFRPGGVWQLMVVGDRVLAATDTGLYWYPLNLAPAPGLAWWLAMILSAVAITLAAAAFALRPAAARLERAPAGVAGTLEDTFSAVLARPS